MRPALMALIFLVLAFSMACIAPATPTPSPPPTTSPPLKPLKVVMPTPEPPATDAEKLALGTLAEKTAKGLYEIREECVSQEITGKLSLNVAELFIKGEAIYETIAMEIEAFDVAHGSDLSDITTPQKFNDLLTLTLAMEYAALRLEAICGQPVGDEQEQDGE